MPAPKHASHIHMTRLAWVPAGELQVGDCPVSLDGWRPLTRVRIRPRAKDVVLWTERKITQDKRGRTLRPDTLILTRRADV